MTINKYRPISFKYLTGWGGDLVDNSTAGFVAGIAIDDVKKILRKQNRRDRENLRDRWKKLYTFYAGELLDEETNKQAQEDGYLKLLDRDLNLD